MTRRIQSAPSKNDRSVWLSFLVHDSFPDVPISWLDSLREDPTAESLFKQVADDYLEETPLEIELGDDDTLAPACKNAVLALVREPLELIKELAELSFEKLEMRVRSRKDELDPDLDAIAGPELDRRIRDKYWDAYEAAAISLGLNPTTLTEPQCQLLVNSPLAGGVLENARTLRRAIAANDLAPAFTPQKFFSWATEYAFPINAAVLSKAVEIGLAEPLSLSEKLAIAQDRIASLQTQLAEHQKSLRLLRETEDDFNAKSLTSLRRIAVGLAVAHHSKNKNFESITFAHVVDKLRDYPEYAIKIDAVTDRLREAQAALKG